MTVCPYQFCRPIKKRLVRSGDPLSASAAILDAYMELPADMRKSAVLTVDADYDTGQVLAVNVCGIRRATAIEAVRMAIGDSIYLAIARFRAAIARATGAA